MNVCVCVYTHRQRHIHMHLYVCMCLYLCICTFYSYFHFSDVINWLRPPVASYNYLNLSFFSLNSIWSPFLCHLSAKKVCGQFYSIIKFLWVSKIAVGGKNELVQGKDLSNLKMRMAIWLFTFSSPKPLLYILSCVGWNSTHY